MTNELRLGQHFPFSCPEASFSRSRKVACALLTTALCRPLLEERTMTAPLCKSPCLHQESDGPEICILLSRPPSTKASLPSTLTASRTYPFWGQLRQATLEEGMGGHDSPPQYPCLEKPLGTGAWGATVHRVAKRQTRLKWLSMRAHTQDKADGALYTRFPSHPLFQFSSAQFSCLIMSDSLQQAWTTAPGLPVHHQLPEFAQTHVHWVGDTINHLILCCPLLLLPSIFPSIRVFWNESALCIRWPKYWSFSFNISPSNEHPDWSPLGWTGWISLQSKGLSRVFSNTIVQKHQFFCTQFSL